jgi:two-component system LytT family sensor kinase
VLGWQFLMGLWLYGVIAGISYAIQTQRRAHANELRALRAEASLNAVRLDALRSRLHPHFLFNALHTVAALARQDATRAENAIEKLGEMLRYTLQDDRGDIVPFREEWEFTRRYLEFEQLRYETRLSFSAQIDPDSLSCSAPSFALQTLVENAVRHSIAKRPEGGRIQIVARRDGEGLQVRVRDDGNGIDEGEHGLRYGLRTLRERLDAVYGNRAQLTTSSTSPGYEVSLTIPCRRAHEDDHDD